MQVEAEPLNRNYEEGLKPEMRVESEAEKIDIGNAFDCIDAVEISSNDVKTADTDSTAESEHDTSCIETQPPVGMHPTDDDISFHVTL